VSRGSECRRWPRSGAFPDRDQGWSPRLRQVDDSIHPVPAATFIEPELGKQARLLTVLGTLNGAAEQDQAAVTFPRAQHLARVPR
jgi:hypothetical protein